MEAAQKFVPKYDFNRMVVRFTIMNKKTEVFCAITTEALDYIDCAKLVKPAEREAQYVRLRAKIDACAEKSSTPSSLRAIPQESLRREAAINSITAQYANSAN